MAFSRPLLAFALSAALSVAGADLVSAQDLSQASLTMNSDWSGGYMGLGGNLRPVVGHRHRSKSEKTAVSAKAARPARRDARPTKVSFGRTSVTPTFLIAQSLDFTGLNVGMLRTHTQGP